MIENCLFPQGKHLSKTQKQQVSLARAVYKDAEIYLIDNILADMDSFTAQQVFEHVMGPNGILASKVGKTLFVLYFFKVKLL